MSKQVYDATMASINDSLEAKRAEIEQELDQDPQYGQAIVRDQNAGLHDSAAQIERRKREEVERRLQETKDGLEAVAFEEYGGKSQMLKDILSDDFGDAAGQPENELGIEYEDVPKATVSTYPNESTRSSELRSQLLNNQDELEIQFKENAHDIGMEKEL